MTSADEPIDRYGSRGRLTALADALELDATSGRTTTKAALSDMIDEGDWASDLSPRIDGPSGASPDDAADWVFGLLEERLQVLGERYPFSISAGYRLSFSGTTTESLYLTVLGITVAHAWSLPTTPVHDPRNHFEHVLARCVRSVLPRTENFSDHRRKGASFEAALAACGASMRVSTDAGPTPKKAHDDGIDVISMLGWGDGRPGGWAIFGQATCASSIEWEQKLGVPVGFWRNRVGVGSTGIAYLALPYHVDISELRRLTDLEVERRPVFDRLRLVLMADFSLSDIDRSFADLAMDTGVDW